VFADNWPELLIGSALQQLWLDHLLALSMKQARTAGWSWVQFLLIYPEGNDSFDRTAAQYRGALRDDDSFKTLTLEQALESDVLPNSMRHDFRERYLWDD
jgi:hypothetical protein